MIAIEKGVPMPPVKARNQIYPWHDLEVGDSFFVPKKTTHSFSGAVSSMGKKLGRVFRCRTVIENGKRGVRVWRDL